MKKEHEQGVLLDHNYDGIQELDNDLPKWWLYLFYLTIVFAVVYVFVYHVADVAPNQMTEYRLEMESAAEAVAAYKASLPPEVSIESLVLLEDAESLSSGKELYIKNCAQCHGQNGEGGIGPNMTDNYWIYGPEFSQVITIIQNGVISKGMTPWKGILRPQEMQQIASYVLTLQGSNPPNAKAPQGDLYE
jgi:cytochrome c oxidase cbb3-type subunit 3